MPPKKINIESGMTLASKIPAGTAEKIKESRASMEGGGPGGKGGWEKAFAGLSKSFGLLEKETQKLLKAFGNLEKTALKTNKEMAGGPGTPGGGGAAAAGAGKGGLGWGGIMAGNMAADIGMKIVNAVIGTVTERFSQAQSRISVQAAGGRGWMPPPRALPRPTPEGLSSEDRLGYEAFGSQRIDNRPSPISNMLYNIKNYMNVDEKEALPLLNQLVGKGLRSGSSSSANLPFAMAGALGTSNEMAASSFLSGTRSGLKEKGAMQLMGMTGELSKQFGGDRPLALLEEMTKLLDTIAENGEKNLEGMSRYTAFLANRGMAAEDAAKMAQGVNKTVTGNKLNFATMLVGQEYFPGEGLLDVKEQIQLANLNDAVLSEMPLADQEKAKKARIKMKAKSAGDVPIQVHKGLMKQAKGYDRQLVMQLLDEFGMDPNSNIADVQRGLEGKNFSKWDTGRMSAKGISTTSDKGAEGGISKIADNTKSIEKTLVQFYTRYMQALGDEAPARGLVVGWGKFRQRIGEGLTTGRDVDGGAGNPNPPGTQMLPGDGGDGGVQINKVTEDRLRHIRKKGGGVFGMNTTNRDPATNWENLIGTPYNQDGWVLDKDGRKFRPDCSGTNSSANELLPLNSNSSMQMSILKRRGVNLTNMSKQELTDWQKNNPNMEIIGGWEAGGKNSSGHIIQFMLDPETGELVSAENTTNRRNRKTDITETFAVNKGARDSGLSDRLLMKQNETLIEINRNVSSPQQIQPITNTGNGR